ncbi:hypothetical protein [Streptomyces noursei]|uniref:hypothetical protein n=1 Tax=Streptomyces noursei TaxID=1971 RepID=UPI0023B85AE2|nr:hypothetical protein [Streptomyces noursei]
MTALAAGASDLLEHLLLDRIIKIAIVLAALGVLAVGMRLLWRRVGQPKGERE